MLAKTGKSQKSGKTELKVTFHRVIPILLPDRQRATTRGIISQAAAMSASVVSRPSESRTNALASAAGAPIASATCEGVTDPLAHAEPAEAQSPSISKPLKSAMLSVRFHVIPEDIAALAHPVLRHRIVPTFSAEAEGITVNHIIDKILQAVPQMPAAAAL